jgi:hypothetical protein
MLATWGRAPPAPDLPLYMRGEGWRRVRWGNVGRAVAVFAVVAAVVAWPRLEPGPPQLPSDAATPVATPSPLPVTTPSPHPRPPQGRVVPEPARRRRVGSRRRARAPRRRNAPAGRPTPTPRATPPVATPRALPAATQAPDPAVREFSFEVG